MSESFYAVLSDRAVIRVSGPDRVSFLQGLVSNNIEKVEDMQFSEFYRQPEMQKLRNALLYEKYYSRSIIDSDQAVDEFVLPNLKQFTDHF